MSVITSTTKPEAAEAISPSAGTLKDIFETKKQKVAKYAVRDVPSVWLEGVNRDAIYPQECFYRSFLYALNHSSVPGVWLVHGQCGLYFGPHAWVELPDGLVFDGVFQQFFRKGDYQQHIHATERFKYTPMAALLIRANMPLLDDGTIMLWWDVTLNLPYCEDVVLEIDEEKALELLAANDLLYKSRTDPLPYNAACGLYSGWCQDQLENGTTLPFCGQSPDSELSKLVGTTWHLRSVNGPLVTVRANRRVFRLRK